MGPQNNIAYDGHVTWYYSLPFLSNFVVVLGIRRTEGQAFENLGVHRNLFFSVITKMSQRET